VLNRKALAILIALLAAGALAGPCTAGVLFGFQYSIPAPDASYDSVLAEGTLFTEIVPGGYQIVDIVGTRTVHGTEELITGLIAPGGYGGNSNLLYHPNAPFLDGNGLSFTVAGLGSDGFGSINLYSDPSAAYLGTIYTEAYSPSVWYGTLTVTQLPEPSPLVLLPLGIAGVAFWSRIRRTPSHVVT